MQVAIIRTGTANLASVAAAFRRMHIVPTVVEDPAQVEPDMIVVLPGVGAFGAGMAALETRGWPDLLRARFEQDQPTLAICLGWQLLCQDSEESLGAAGLGLLPVSVTRLPANVTVPHFGWNRVESADPSFACGYAYFANSYCVADPDAVAAAGWEVATTRHGVTFVAAARHGNWLACQFHPELSGAFGRGLLKQWLDVCYAKETR